MTWADDILDTFRIPGQQPNSRALYYFAALAGFSLTCYRNAISGCPILKRPQRHLYYMGIYSGAVYALDRVADFNYNRTRRDMLYDTQREAEFRFFGKLSDRPKPLPDSFTKLDINKPYWYPYMEEGEEKRKYFTRNDGKIDLWEGSLQFMDTNREYKTTK